MSSPTPMSVASRNWEWQAVVAVGMPGEPAGYAAHLPYVVICQACPI